MIEMDKIMLWCKIVVACIPAAVIGLLFDDVFEALFYHAFSVAIALIVLFIWLLVRPYKEATTLNVKVKARA